MTKSILKPLSLACILFAVLPLIGVTFLPPDWGLPFLVLTLYILNTMFFIYVGVLTGKAFRHNWCIPLLSLRLFLIATRFIYGTFQPILVIINGVVRVVSILATYLMVKRKATRQKDVE